MLQPSLALLVKVCGICQMRILFCIRERLKARSVMREAAHRGYKRAALGNRVGARPEMPSKRRAMSELACSNPAQDGRRDKVATTGRHRAGSGFSHQEASDQKNNY
jgi:hypothetical protein